MVVSLNGARTARTQTKLRGNKMAEQRKKSAGQPIKAKNGKQDGISMPIGDEDGSVVYDPKDVRHGGLDDGGFDDPAEETNTNKKEKAEVKPKSRQKPKEKTSRPKVTPKPAAKKEAAPAAEKPKRKPAINDEVTKILADSKDNEDALRRSKKFPTWSHVNEKALAKLMKEVKKLPHGLFRMRLGNMLRGSVSAAKRSAAKAKAKK